MIAWFRRVILRKKTALTHRQSVAIAHDEFDDTINSFRKTVNELRQVK